MPWDSIGMSNPFTPSLYLAVSKRSCDLVDAHGHLFWMSALSVRAALDAGKPVITTVHGLLAKRDWLTNLSQEMYIWTVGAWLLRNSSRVVALTECDAKELEKLGVRRRNLRVIPVALDPEEFKPSKRKRVEIVWAGRLVPEKDLDTLLDALALLRDRAPPLTIVGDGPMRGRLVQRVRTLGLSEIVNFLGFVNRREVARLLSESGIFVMPSLKEGLPLILLEAMATENMIISSELPSIVQILGEAGSYFPPRTPAALASILSTAITDEDLRRRKGRMAREIVQERFSWSVVLPKLDELYEEVAG